RLCEFLEITIVQHGNPHREQQQLMQWPGNTVDTRREYVARAFAREHGDIALLKPSRRAGVQSGNAFACGPWSLFSTSSPASRSNQNRVARANVNSGTL